MRYLRNLGNQIKVSLPTDEHGYIGRECPNDACKGYFKIVNGTGLKGITACNCPYCGCLAEQKKFATSEQIEYAKSVAFRQITDAVTKDLKSMEFDVKPKGGFGIGLSVKVKPGRQCPIRWYREKTLETHIECSNCTLKYAVYGIFAFCPDCRQHNSLQILNKNLELAAKMLDMAATSDADIAERLIENALEDCVSAFDGFGREICRVYANKASEPAKAEKISFQNLEGAKQSLIGIFGLDLAAGLSIEEWKVAIRGFQKRHLLSHKMGVVDEEYMRKSGDAQAVVGRKIIVSADEVIELIGVISKLAKSISGSLQEADKNT